MLQLAVAFRAGADHCGHDGADYGLRRDGRRGGVRLFAERTGGIRVTFQAPVRDHEAFGDGLFG